MRKRNIQRAPFSASFGPKASTWNLSTINANSKIWLPPWSRNGSVMAKPIIWTIDDDPAVLRAIERDLRRQFSNRYRIMAADSGEAARSALAELKLRNDPVALFLVDQRMPGVSGVEFLQKALQVYPNAKRALLTAYADTNAAIAAINSTQIDYYFMKP